VLQIVHARISAPSARLIAEQSENIEISEGITGDVNWGRYKAETTLNPDITVSTNKRSMREKFRDAGVPMPRLFTVEEAKEAVAETGVGVLGRPDRHWKGRGFWLCTSAIQIDKALEGTAKKRPATHFMEYIQSERAPKEFRAHIFQGKSIRISEKAHTEFHKYTTARPTVDVTSVREAAKQAIAAVGLDFGAVDILASKDGREVWVLEVNAAPGLGGSMPRVYAETFLKWKEQQDA
jgi:glutathione synthase/RimK-type ligase-like ATP-grasp enzyme